jgi:outer membrane protein assembly factor BamB
VKHLKLLVSFAFWMVGEPLLTSAASFDVPTFHRDQQRTGWDNSEPKLTRKSVSSGEFQALWESPEFDSFGGKPARLYASPIYVDRVNLSYGRVKDYPFGVVLAASSNGFVYAVNAFKVGPLSPGTILWRTQLGKPCYPGFDGLNTGILSTPIVDIHRKVLYVATCEGPYTWKVYALDIRTGEPLSKWPVAIDPASLPGGPVAKRGEPPTTTGSGRPYFGSQRGALNLSPDGAHLYVVFGESTTGWIVSVDTANARVVSAFATVSSPHNYAGGIWGAAGPAVDTNGRLFVVSGASFGGLKLQPHDWAQSVLALSDTASGGLVLRGTYTPFNYCATAQMDIDLGSGGPAVLPNLDPASTKTPYLLVVGGKQGNVYLLNRVHLGGALDQRPACSTDSSHDASLLSPVNQPQFSKPGPLNVFGPYTDTTAAVDQARGRSVPAYFRGPEGTNYLFVTGSTKTGTDSTTSIPPGLARLKIDAHSGRAAYLEIGQLESTVTFENPGSPLVTSSGSREAIVWVLDENARRSASLDGPNSPHPLLYAFDAMTLKLLWRSGPAELHTSGKYNEPAITHGTVFVGTDRIQAFGIPRG